MLLGVALNDLRGGTQDAPCRCSRRPSRVQPGRRNDSRPASFRIFVNAQWLKNMNMTRKTFHPRIAVQMSFAATVLAFVAACSSTPPPVAEISAAQTAVTAAEQADAAQHAPADLDRARDKVLRAQAAMQDDENDQARRLAEQALVDARLAEAKARADVARQNADQVQAGIDELSSEAGAGAPTPLVRP